MEPAGAVGPFHLEVRAALLQDLRDNPRPVTMGAHAQLMGAYRGRRSPALSVMRGNDEEQKADPAMRKRLGCRVGVNDLTKLPPLVPCVKDCPGGRP
jgi:hypothetical protein